MGVADDRDALPVAVPVVSHGLTINFAVAVEETAKARALYAVDGVEKYVLNAMPAAASERIMTIKRKERKVAVIPVCLTGV